MKRWPTSVVLAILCTLASGGSPLNSSQNGTPGSTSVEVPPPYHDRLSTDPFPTTLDPNQFGDNRPAVIAYTLAARIKDLLFQMPCYCGCDRDEHHRSLLDCYTSEHAEWCRICQKELMFCYLQRRKGKNPSQIRMEIAEGKAWRVNLHSLDHLLSLPPAAPK